eukprot:jgi/Ulvmu1/5870/UM025_0132.1
MHDQISSDTSRVPAASPQREFRASAFFQHDTWEPGLVVLVWPLFTGFWYIVDTCIPQARRFRIQDKHDTSHWKFEGFGRKQEVLLYILPLALFDVVYPRRDLPVLPPSFARLVADVFLSLFFYDLFFTAIHYSSHKVPWLYRHMHGKHHTHRVQRASEALRLSAGDQVLDVGCSIAALNLVGAHPLSRSVYNVVIVWLIIELHAGYNFPWMLQNVVPFGIWGGSTRHDAHHQYGTVYYQKFFTYLDNAFGNVLPDTAHDTVRVRQQLREGSCVYQDARHRPWLHRP